MLHNLTHFVHNVVRFELEIGLIGYSSECSSYPLKSSVTFFLFSVIAIKDFHAAKNINGDFRRVSFILERNYSITSPIDGLPFVNHSLNPVYPGVYLTLCLWQPLLNPVYPGVYLALCLCQPLFESVHPGVYLALSLLSTTLRIQSTQECT